MPRQKLQLARFALMQKLGRLRFDPHDFEVTRITVAIPTLEPIFDNYRIVHISDIHLGQWLSPVRLDGVVGIVNALEADVVAITGDFVSFVVDPFVDELSNALSNLRPKDATLAVMGNHDHWMNPEKVRKALEQSGVIELRNDVYTVTRKDALLYFAGVDDVTVGADRLDLILEKLPSVGPAVLLVHEPDFADISSATGRFALQLSGHSHGGQIVLPVVGPPIRGSYCKKYPLGRYQVGDMVVYTNRGLGANTFWIRINCPPEITVITLKSTS
ncbi:MAG TPA: metallophosphoesterase [Candidatus Acidoferrum sp.]|nr:metallophosphoesterase [Candidatus Acidoferrum sp.]